MAKGRLLAIVLLVGVALHAALAQPVPRGVYPSVLDGRTPEEVLALANAWARDPSKNGVVSSVTSQEIRLAFANGEKRTVPLPRDRMVLAIAPYVGKTHPCRDHAISSCQGEQVGIDVRIRAFTPEGRSVLDMTATTLANGFLEVWLPRNLTLNLEIDALGLRATGTVSTVTGAQTCLTTLRLRPEDA
jgi:hypothetical protein